MLKKCPNCCQKTLQYDNHTWYWICYQCLYCIFDPPIGVSVYDTNVSHNTCPTGNVNSEI